MTHTHTQPIPNQPKSHVPKRPPVLIQWTCAGVVFLTVLDRVGKNHVHLIIVPSKNVSQDVLVSDVLKQNVGCENPKIRRFRLSLREQLQERRTYIIECPPINNRNDIDQ